MRTTSRLIFATPLLLASARSAFAHAYLQSAVPPPDSTVTQTPTEVTIVFTGPIEPRYTTIQVTDGRSQRVDDSQPHSFAGDASRLSVGLRGISPGTYVVTWHATSVDTHQTDGSYRFTVAATDASNITLEHAWARPTAGAATTGVVYVTVTDKGSADHLVGVSTPIAAAAELHEMINDNGIMKMHAVPSIALDPGKPVSFNPGGYHIMLVGLKGPLKVSGSFPLTLTFEHAQPITVMAKVEATGGANMDHGAMPGMPGMQGQ
jgi:copper(I)-binding protein